MSWISKFVSCFIIGCLFLITLAEEYNRDEEDDVLTLNDLRDLGSSYHVLQELSSKALQKRFSCKQSGERCGGVIPCCGSYQCFWEKGYNALKKGVCVDCVQQGQYCQRDMQCCSGFVCQKDRVFHINGKCDIKRPLGSNCHDTDQCVSNRCNFTGWQWAKFQEGKCL